MASPSQSGSSRWRGNQGAKSAEPRYRWQQSPAAAAGGWYAYWLSARLGLLLAGFVGLVAFLVYDLMHVPLQTPLVAVVAPPYAWPLPANDWAQEDLERLASLEGQTLNVLDGSAAWSNRDRGLQSFDRQLRDVAKAGSRTGTVVIYLSMHGAVDGTGAACLIPPGASPLKSETWLPVREVLSHIQQQNLPHEWHKLLILDAGRLGVNWNLGQLYNGFADRLASAVDDAKIPNLVVLNSAGSGQSSWTSAELAGSAFGYFLQRGLAGAADDTSEGGNGDRQVSLHELLNYLQQHVDAWSVANRSEHQRPLLVPAEAPDFNVAWSLSRRSLQRLLGSRPRAVDPAVTQAAITDLWRAHDQLASQQPLRFDPLNWRDFEQQLIWLEQSSVAGKAYAAGALGTLADLQNRVQRIQDRLGAASATAKPIAPEAAAATAGSEVNSATATLTPGATSADSLGILARGNLFSDRPIDKSLPIAGHTLPMLEYLGQMKPNRINDMRAALERLQKSATKTDVVQALTAFPSRDEGPLIAESHLLRMWHRWLPEATWKQPDLIARAISGRAQIERLAAPADERAQWAIAPLLIKAELTRHAAEDLLFSGNETDLTAAAPSLDQADAQSDAVKMRADQALAAVAMRDRALAQLPYLARWIARPLPLGESSDHADREISQTVLPAIDNVQKLNDALATMPAAGDGTPEWSELHQQLAAQVAALDNLFVRHCNYLVKQTAADARNWRDLNSVLQTPMLDAPRRERFVQLRGQQAAKLDAAFVDHKPSKRDATADKIKPQLIEPTAYLDRVGGHWDQHPAEALLIGRQRAPATASRATIEEHLDQQGDALRVCLTDIPAQLQQLPPAAKKSAAADAVGGVDAALADLNTVRQRLLSNEKLVRQGASFWFPTPVVDPIRRLRQFDVQQLLLNQARRALDEFWGPAAEHDRAYFDVVAADAIRAAQATGEILPEVQPQFDRLTRLLELRRDAARRGLQATAADVLSIGGDDVTLQVGVRDGAEAAAQALPPGKATMLVRDAAGRIAGASRSVSVPFAADEANGGQTLSFNLPAASLADRGPMLQAVALFRGNAFVAPLMLRAAGGNKIEIRPYVYGPAKITLAGRGRKRASVVFILDCSASMQTPADVEGPGGDKQAPRIDIARASLDKMMLQLAAAGDARVGVRLFGHRVGWNTKKPDQLLKQTGYGRDIPDSIKPSEDVELVLPLGRFDSVLAGGVSELLKTVKPWGETPLYLSLVEAEKDFVNDDDGTEKSIVVITDGVNYQFNAPQPTKREDIKVAAANRKVAVHIVGFGISKEESAEAEKEFRAIATDSGGSFVSVNNATALVRTLENLLGPRQYTVSDGRQQLAAADVGAAVSVDKPRLRKTFNIALGPAKQSVPIDGGEAIELRLASDARQIEAPRYEKGDPQFLPLVRGSRGISTGQLVGVHRPLQQADGVRFPISFQRDDGAVPTRPAEVWIEITPQTVDRKAATTYTFYDANFEPGLPVPLGNCSADHWPATAKTASVQVWCKSSSTKPNWTLHPSAIEDSPAPPKSLDGLAGVTYQTRTRRGGLPGESGFVSFVERHDQNSPGLSAIKVELFPRPLRIVHRFDHENHLVTHEFFVDNIEDAVGRYELRITRREDAQADAVRTADPLVVSVSSSSDVLRLTPE